MRGVEDQQKLDELHTTGAYVPYEKEYFRKDGSRVPVLVVATRWKKEADEGVAFILDLTEQKRAEDALKELNRSLEQRVQERTAQLRAEIAERERVEAQLRQSQKMDAVGRLTGGSWTHSTATLRARIRPSVD